MFKKIVFNGRLSQRTVGNIHRYLLDFGQGAHRVFWLGDRAYLETDCASDITLRHTKSLISFIYMRV